MRDGTVMKAGACTWGLLMGGWGNEAVHPVAAPHAQ